MSVEAAKRDIAALENANAQLTESLERCRQLLSECREKLTVNSNDLEEIAKGDGVQRR